MTEHEHKIIESNQVGSIEENDIRPIKDKDRGGEPKSLFLMWLGANINYVVLLTGALVISLGLSIKESILAVVVGNLLGCTVLGLASIMGPRTGSSGIITSRVSFGQAGAFLPIAISSLSVLGWFSINSVISTEGLVEIFKVFGVPDTGITMWVALALVLVAEILLAIYGHATIIAAERIIAVVLGIIFFGLLLFVLPKVDWTWANTVDVTTGASSFGTWLLAMGIVFSYPISWTNFASDYSRYFERNTSWKKVAFFAGAGQFVALTFCEIIGVLFAVALGGSLTDPVKELPNLLPTWYLVPFLFAVMLGSIATNVPNGYTAGLGLLALRIPLTRVKSVLLIGGFTLLFRIATLIFGQFFALYQQWLTYIIIWSCPWIAIVVVDYFMRKGNYLSNDLMKWKSGEYWYKSGFFWPGIISFVIGLGVSLLFSNSALFVSPLVVNYMGGADLSFEMGMLSAGLSYYLFAKNHPTFAKAKALKDEDLVIE